MSLENNQDNSKWGGARKNAGRKAGSCTTKTREIANKAIEGGITPIEYLLSVMRDVSAEPNVRMDAAKSAAPYVHPRLASENITLSGDNDNPLVTELLVKVIEANG